MIKGSYFYKSMETSKDKIEQEVFKTKVDPNEPHKLTKEHLTDVIERHNHAYMFIGDFTENHFEVICEKVCNV